MTGELTAIGNYSGCINNIYYRILGTHMLLLLARISISTEVLLILFQAGLVALFCIGYLLIWICPSSFLEMI